jgi:glycosyltransferase involved in cell wall biosynthesis
MNVLLVEPYYGGSHAAWVDGYREYSRHRIETLTLSGSSWKWRMHGGAVTLARRFNESSLEPDLILATDMLDVTTFHALTRARTAGVPFVTYFHENQLTYPWSEGDRDVRHRRDKHYGFINYATALASDAVFFNSAYHMESFLGELVRFLEHFPDHHELGSIGAIREKSAVLHLGLDLRRFDATRVGAAALVGEGPPIVLWNHRWEYDKNPEAFFAALDALAARGVAFRVAILGENFAQRPEAFERARERLGERVVCFGYAESFDDYAAWLHAADVLPVTSRQDFFGASVVEAIYCGCLPLLPRRLAYPELIPEAYHGTVFYDDESELTDKLERALVRTPPPPPRALRVAAGGFDWSVLAPVYDDSLERIVEGGKVSTPRRSTK